MSLPALRRVTLWDEDELEEAARPAIRRFLSERRLSRASQGRLIAWHLAKRQADRADFFGGYPTHALVCDGGGWLVSGDGEDKGVLEAVTFDEYLREHEEWVWDFANRLAVEGGLG